MLRKTMTGLCAATLLVLAGALASMGCSDQVSMPSVEALSNDTGRSTGLTPLDPSGVLTEKVRKKATK